MHRLSVRIDSFRVVTKAFDAFGNLDKRAEVRHAQDLAMHDVADAVLREERIPNVGLNLLHAEREAPLVRFNARMTALTLSPFFNTSEGCFTRVVQLRLLTCTRPSIPSSISMKAPNSVRLRTRPSTVAPTGYLSCSVSHGLDASCRMPSDIRRSVGLTLRTTHSTSSVTLTSFDGCS